LYKQDRFCEACHHLQLRTSQWAPGVERPTCVQCHMQRRKLLNFEGDAKNHYFPGSNSALPHVLGDRTAQKVMRDWLSGDLVLDVHQANWRTLADTMIYDDPQKTVLPYTKDFWLWMNVVVPDPPKPGADMNLRIITTNVGMNHAFPTSALDLLECWLEVIVTDADDNIVYHSGALDKNLRVDPEAHRMGGYFLDENHMLLKQNRVWATTAKVVERVVMSLEQVVDDYMIPIPQNVKGPITIRAYWNYRYLNQDYVDWAFPNRHITMPVCPVGKVIAQADVDNN